MSNSKDDLRTKSIRPFYIRKLFIYETAMEKCLDRAISNVYILKYFLQNTKRVDTNTIEYNLKQLIK